MRIALVHDWLTGMRGGERVLHQLAQMYPAADLKTLFHVPGRVSSSIESLDIQASALNRLPGMAAHYRKLLPLFPWAISQFRLREYDLVISTSHAVAKCVSIDPDTVHLDYCFTPMRYVWDQADAYLGQGALRLAARPLIRHLQRFDAGRSDREHVTRFVAISDFVARRIGAHYGRRASVVYPPVDVDRIVPSGRGSEDFYLLVGGFVPYKREALAIEAFRELDRELVVVGDGPSRALLERGAPRNVEFVGRVRDAELAQLYTRCRALIYPQEEDFGIVAVEAQAAGRPVIAYAGGGALETVVPLDSSRESPNELAPDFATGVFFEEPTPVCLRTAVRTFEENMEHFDAKQIRRHAEDFGAQRFRHQFEAEVQHALAREG